MPNPQLFVGVRVCVNFYSFNIERGDVTLGCVYRVGVTSCVYPHCIRMRHIIFVSVSASILKFFHNPNSEREHIVKKPGLFQVRTIQKKKKKKTRTF